MNDIVVNKIQSIPRCILRAREEFAADPDGFDTNFTRQDAAILNILRASEQSIDLANYVIKTRKLGIPVSTAESFDLLQIHGAIGSDLAGRLRGMVGFRNAVVHRYQRTDMVLVRKVIELGRDDLIAFGDAMLANLAEKAN
ncbi:MAG TPA: DUF86 domain-containing protein [Promineifilum sp.]